MKNELTIEHIGRRLSLGVKCYGQGMVVETTEYDDNPIPKLFNIVGADSVWVEATSEFDTFRQSIMIEDCILLLRPLSDLIKPITHKCETFVPIERLSEKFRMNIEVLKSVNILDCKYADIQKLLEWHFVIDEPDGTWIDANTLDENPYK